LPAIQIPFLYWIYHKETRINRVETMYRQLSKETCDIPNRMSTQLQFVCYISRPLPFLSTIKAMHHNGARPGLIYPPAGADIAQAIHAGQDASVINRHAPGFSQYRDPPAYS
jgi:hypothetical protein